MTDQTLQPVKPADVLVGDRVRVVNEGEVAAASKERNVLRIGGVWVHTEGATLYLLDRPHPDAELIERMARAIYDDNVRRGFDLGGWDDIAEAVRDDFRQDARVALAVALAVVRESGHAG